MELLLRQLKHISELFDLGCTIDIGDDGFSITGRNFLPESIKGDVNTAYVEHVFGAEWEYTDEDPRSLR